MQSRNPISTFCLVPQVIDAVGIPVVAAGGTGQCAGAKDRILPAGEVIQSIAENGADILENCRAR